MSRRFGRWLIIGVLALGAIAVAVVASLPYAPWIHGTTGQEVERLAQWLNLEPGMRVADIGAGDGTYAVALARRLELLGGHVYATELDPERLDDIRAAVAEAGLANVTVVAGDVVATNLPDACCHAIFSRNVYHHMSEPEAMNADIRRALQPDGRLLVIDFEPGSALDWIARPQTAERHGGHGTPRDTVIEEVTAAGFEVARGPEPWRGRLYAVLFSRKDEAAPTTPVIRAGSSR